MTVLQTLKKRIITCLATFALLGIITPIQIADASKQNLSYLYFNQTSFSKYVEDTNGALNTIAPSYFDLHEDGTLDTSNVNPEFIAIMKKKGIRVVPFLSNHWNRTIGRKAMENREQLVQQIVQAVEKYNLDGVNVDIENLTEADRLSHNDFIKLLKEKMPADKEVLYCVVYRGELGRLKQLVRSIDSRAFIVVNKVADVLGEGFREDV